KLRERGTLRVAVSSGVERDCLAVVSSAETIRESPAADDMANSLSCPQEKTMLQRVYRISTRYWLISTLIVMVFLTILCVIIGGIPGFPHFAEVIARWQKI